MPLSNLGIARSAVVLTVLLALLIWETCKPFFPFFRMAMKKRVQHLARNLILAMLNAGLIALIFSPLWSEGAAWSANTGSGMLHRAGVPLWLHVSLAILILDIWTYWWHRANHQIAFFWRFHRMHHSDPWMDVSSSRRFHPGEIVLSSVLRVGIIMLFGIHPQELVLYGLLMGIVVDFHHANIVLPESIDRLLRIVMVTPAMHKVHHSQVRDETNSNYTSLLSLWDRLFGSFRLCPNLSAIRIGLEGWSDAAHQTISGMLTSPLRSLR